MAASLGSEQDRRRRRRKPAQPNHLGAALDLAVEAFERVGGMDLGAVLLGKGHVGQHVLLGAVEQSAELGQLGADLICDLAPLGAGGAGVLLGVREAGGTPRPWR